MTDRKKIRAVIFDLDGTLIDSLEIWREVDEEFFARRGMQIPQGYQETIAHLGFRECAAYTVKNYMPTESEEAIVAEALCGDGVFARILSACIAGRRR